MAKDVNILSTSITNLDAINPAVMVTAGQGAAGQLFEVDDFCAATAAGLGTIGSYYRLVRFPTQVKIKSFEFGADAIIDTSATASLAFDFNIAFSDSTIDGTPPNQQALIPTTANTGATVSFATYTAANKLFGTKTQPTANTRWPLTAYTDNGIGSTYPWQSIAMQPLWQTFGFTAAAGQNQDPGGNFDLVAYVSTAAGTGHAGNIIGKVSYVK